MDTTYSFTQDKQQVNLVSGAVVVGVSLALPILGVFLLLDNDLASEKVIPYLQDLNKHELMSVADMCIDNNPELFHLCAMT